MCNIDCNCRKWWCRVICPARCNNSGYSAQLENPNRFNIFGGIPSYIGRFSYVPFQESINNPVLKNEEINEIEIIDLSELSTSEKIDLKEFLNFELKIINIIDNIPLIYKDIAIEQIDVLLSIQIEKERVDLSKEAEIAILVFRGLYNS